MRKQPRRTTRSNRARGRLARVGGSIVAAVACAAVATPAGANDIAPFTTLNGDIANAGLGGMRSLGNGTLTLNGVNGTVRKAFLYWHGPTSSTDDNANANVTFAGTPITGTQIGVSSDNCWGFANSRAYRADVTSLVSGNGDFALADFTKPNVEINGVSLIVLYTDADPTNNRDLVLFDGNDSNRVNTFDANGWNISLPGSTTRAEPRTSRCTSPMARLALVSTTMP